MARSLKPYKVDVVRHKNGVQQLDVMFDRNRKVFFAQIGMERVEHSDLKAVFPLARELLERAPSYEWVGIIEVDSPSGHEDDEHWVRRDTRRESVSLEFSFERLEVCQDSLDVSVMYERQHTLDFELLVASYKASKERYGYRSLNAQERRNYEKRDRAERESNGKLRTHHRHSSRVELPYTEERWQGLLAVKAAIKRLRAQLGALVDRPDFERVVAQLAAQDAFPQLPPARGRKVAK